MNICFRVKDPKTEKQFLAEAEERLLQGLKGHRSVVSHVYKSINTCLKLSFVLIPFLELLISQINIDSIAVKQAEILTRQNSGRDPGFQLQQRINGQYL